MGIDAIYLVNALDASYPSGVVNNFYNLNLAKGSKEDFELMVKTYLRQEIAIVLRICVDSTTLQCGMFKDDQQRQEFYPVSEQDHLWQDEQGNSLWHRHEDEYYLSHRGKEFPLLDWHSPALRSRMGKVVRHWMSQGIKGFVFAGVDGCMYDRQGEQNFHKVDDENIRVVRFLKDVVAEQGDCCSLGELVYGQEEQKFTTYANKGFDLLLRGLPSGLALPELDETVLRWQGKFLGFPHLEPSEQSNQRLCTLANIILSSQSLLLQDNSTPQELQSYRDDNLFSFLLDYKKRAVLGVEKVLSEKDFRGFLLKCVESVYLLGINFSEKEAVWKGVQADKVEILPFGDTLLGGATSRANQVVLSPFSLALCRMRW